MSDVRRQMSGDRGQRSEVRVFREDASQIEGAGESFPCRGVSTGTAPLKVLILVFTPLRGHNTEHERFLSHGRRGPPILAGAWGERGLAPYFREDAKIGTPKLALASAKPTLTVKVFELTNSPALTQAPK
ncbi:MAG: hypothetical protein LBI62_08880, partial [Candidatus Accumulibacter sp.]|nr:hypothetical protein [Accumulibacter sp.]